MTPRPCPALSWFFFFFKTSLRFASLFQDRIGERADVFDPYADVVAMLESDGWLGECTDTFWCASVDDSARREGGALGKVRYQLFDTTDEVGSCSVLTNFSVQSCCQPQ